MPGPAPQKSAIRANARPDWVTLPPAGRDGPPPAWPFESKPAGTTARWVRLWALPQATQWETLKLTHVVARYVLCLLVGEDLRSMGWNAAVLAEARQLEDRLGLSPMAMRRLQWEIGAVEATGTTGATVTKISSVRDL